MRSISNITRSNCYGKTYNQIGNFGNDIKNNTKELINKANNVNILVIFNKYNIQVDQYNNKIICPFKHHSNGSERTASFMYYHNTNSFYCWGCKKGGGSCEFVSIMENISTKEASRKILEMNSSSSLEKYNQIQDNDWEEKFKIKLFFSSKIRDFIKSHSDDDVAIKFIENICFAFDSLIFKYHVEIEGLKTLVNRLIGDINKYK